MNADTKFLVKSYHSDISIWALYESCKVAVCTLYCAC